MPQTRRKRRLILINSRPRKMFPSTLARKSPKSYVTRVKTQPHLHLPAFLKPPKLPHLCFCQILPKLIQLCQLIGIFPMKLRVRSRSPVENGGHYSNGKNPPPEGNNHHYFTFKGPHQVNNSWISPCILESGEVLECQGKFWGVPSILNIFAMAIYSFFLHHVYHNIHSVLTNFFVGIELHALTIQVTTLYVKVVIIILFSRWRAPDFSGGWGFLFKVHETLAGRGFGGRARVDPTLKYYALVNILVVGVSTLGYISFFATIIIVPCLQGLSPKLACSAWSTTFFQKVVHLFIVLYYQSFCSLFLHVSLTIRSLHEEIGMKLQYVLGEVERGEGGNEAPEDFKGQFPEGDGHGLLNGIVVIPRPGDSGGGRSPYGGQGKGLETLRIAHEHLCLATESFSKYFGIPAIVIVCSAFVSITCGIYTMLTAGTRTDGGMRGVHYFIWNFHTYFGFLTLVVTLVAGQLMKSSGILARRVIYGAAFSNLSPRMKFEIALFSQKLMHVPRISAWGITDIGAGLFAAAVTNIVTYLLVLVQFRFSGLGPVSNNGTITSF